MAFRNVPVNTPLLHGAEKARLVECIESGWISSEGPFVREFEERFAGVVQRQHGIAVVNGTAALDVAFEALRIGEGDEVILPSFTIISCVHQIIRSGAVPVVVDSDPLTWNMNVSQIESQITTRTRAILVVHIYGLPVDMNPLLEIARRYQLAVIEDAAEMHGQTYRGQPCGSFGDISTFSFYPNKLITTGEGGMIVTDKGELEADCRSLRNLCFQPERRFVHSRLGWNYRMTNLQAALGLAQLEHIADHVGRKRRMGAMYTELLQSLDGVQLPLLETEYAKNIYWVYGIVISDERRQSADEVMEQLRLKGVGTRPFFYPMHLQPVLKDRGLFEGLCLPVCERLARKGFYLPSGLGITDAEIEYSARALIEVLE